MIVGSNGKLPLLRNATPEEIERFQQQVEIIDLIGEERMEAVMEIVEAANGRNPGAFKGPPIPDASASQKAVEHITCWSRESLDYKSDPAGFFVIQVDPQSRTLLAEHYSTDFELLRVLHGKTALEVYSTIIRNDWITSREHAAYLGRELGKAELALQQGLVYEQNKELMES